MFPVITELKIKRTPAAKEQQVQDLPELPECVTLHFYYIRINMTTISV